MKFIAFYILYVFHFFCKLFLVLIILEVSKRYDSLGFRLRVSIAFFPQIEDNFVKIMNDLIILPEQRLDIVIIKIADFNYIKQVTLGFVSGSSGNNVEIDIVFFPISPKSLCSYEIE